MSFLIWKHEPFRRNRNWETDPSTSGKKGSRRGSSVPPGSATAKARAQAEEREHQESKGKGSTKGTSKGQGKETQGKGKGKIPPDYEIRPSDPLTSIMDKRDQVTETRRPFLGRTWELLKKSLAAQSVSSNNIGLLELGFTYVQS